MDPVFSMGGFSLCIRPIRMIDLNDEYFSLLSQLSPMDIHTLDKTQIDAYFKMLNDHHQIFVIEDVSSGKIIGSGTTLIEEKLIHNFGKVGHIEDIVIDNQYRGISLGKAMVEHLTDHCIFTRKCYKCILNCSFDNKVFYEKCDYKNNGLQMSLYDRR